MADNELTTLRHSAAHIMAAAVQSLYPGVKLDIGPATEDGFYYDFDLEHRFAPEDLETIEAEMQRLAGQKQPFVRKEMSRAEAEKLLKDRGQTYKVERLADIPEGEAISFYETGDFIDLCRGPHVEHSGQIGAVKLLSIAGSYYRGREQNPMLQRVYGTAFRTRDELKAYLRGLEEARRRDHRKLGVELELFSTHEPIGAGLICWHPKGGRVRHLIETFWKQEHYAHGYELLYTPHIGRAELWQTSGHLDFYRDAMYAPLQIDEVENYIKPMNCPFHIQIYKNRPRSYRELPLRWAELGTVYRYEKAGVLHGLLRVRGFTQDDAHIICTPEQIESEIRDVLAFSLFMWKSFGFPNVKAYLATRPEKAVGEPARWEQALQSLEKAVAAAGLDCEVDPGGGAFYGPKIDLKIKDAIGREWQTTTIQFDFNLPERFDMTYVGADGQRHRPYMVHRALLGSIERFFGILIEHYAGAFPVWLAPEQVRILAISDPFVEYARKVEAQLRQAQLRVTVDAEPDKIGAKIRRGRNQRIPYLLIVGEREAETGQVSVRGRGDEGDQGASTVEAFVEKIDAEIREKR
ncbi:MAG: threonine--tRNA ligase [Lentisphaerae bacterium RIFOXYB12_FULL_65_16]|nr:MAG: threonine--tRNA ligase [Lentisphaerae bacterium RIFOXYA12_64_32]OGV89356.1 MAG: threonine--tRNA ligase [Lentisphaerae bacterium RIFOXYB12_FULL_65_16]